MFKVNHDSYKNLMVQGLLRSQQDALTEYSKETFERLLENSMFSLRAKSKKQK